LSQMDIVLSKYKRLSMLARIARDRRAAFAIAQDYRNGERVGRHAHPVGQLLHATSGVMIALADKHVWTVTPGRALWIPAHIEHSFRMRGTVKVRALYVRPGVLSTMGNDVTDVVVSPLANELIVRLVDLDREDAKSNTRSRLRDAILPVLRLELASSPGTREGLRIPSNAAASAIAKSILANPEDRLVMEQLARRYGIGAKTLSRRFTAETGLTPDAWRRTARLNEAAARLRTGQTVSEVAYDLGYETVSGFCRAYHTHFSETPGSARSDAARV
jgi:AraC-like DNA-binding protein/quercetin dioxygenase-like cupin family protein